MKTSVTLLLLAISLVCCNSTPNSSDYSFSSPNVKHYFCSVKRMQYLILVSHGFYNYGTSTVINLTKDSLECAYYRKQLTK